MYIYIYIYIYILFIKHYSVQYIVHGIEQNIRYIYIIILIRFSQNLFFSDHT